MEATYSNNLSPNKRERRLLEHGKPTQEASLRSGNTVELYKRTGVFPVTESNTVVVWATSEVQDDTKDDEASDSDHLNGAVSSQSLCMRFTDNRRDVREDEFTLAIYASAEQIDDNDNYEADRDPNSVVDLRGPEVDEDGGCAEFCREKDCPVIP